MSASQSAFEDLRSFSKLQSYSWHENTRTFFLENISAWKLYKINYKIKKYIITDYKALHYISFCVHKSSILSMATLTPLYISGLMLSFTALQTGMSVLTLLKDTDLFTKFCPVWSGWNLIRSLKNFIWWYLLSSNFSYLKIMIIPVLEPVENSYGKIYRDIK